MRAEQRVTKSPTAFAPHGQRRWIPYTVHGAQGGRRTSVDVQPGDRYVTVDDVADGMVVMEVSAWPILDREGRLYWDTDPVELVMARADAQAVVDAARRDAQISAPDRPLRVGDAFLARDVAETAPSLAGASRVVDISAAAREAAKAALYGAAASTLDRGVAERLTVTARYDQPDPATGYFDVRQTSAPRDAEAAT